MLRLVAFVFAVSAFASSHAVGQSADDHQDDVPQNQQLAAIQASDCGTAPFSILLAVKDIRKAEGLVTADLHGDDPKKFLGKGQKLARIRVPAVKGETLMCIPVDRAGVYAIAVYHDEDADHKFDKTWIGLPDEPFGLTNDPKIRLSKPDHEDVAFDVQGPLTPVAATLNH